MDNMRNSNAPLPVTEDAALAWHLPPEGAEELPGMSQQKLHELAAQAEQQPVLQGPHASEPDDTRFYGPVGWRLVWKPLWMTLCFGIPAWLLIIGQMWEPELNAALGGPLGSHNGLVRLAMLFAGAFLLFLAAPMYKPADWTPAKQRDLDRDHAYFCGKRGF